MELNIFESRKTKELKKQVDELTKNIQTLMEKGFYVHNNPSMQRNWETKVEKYDGEIFSKLEDLIKDSRNLELNSAIYSKYLSMCENNIVGPDGFSVSVSVEDYKKGVATQNVKLNKGIESSFLRWSKKSFADIAGKRSLVELKRMMIRTLKRDGEILIKKIRTNSSRENPFGFSLQLLDPRRIDYLYGRDNPENLENGNYVVMGIEFNQYHKPVAYWLRLGGDNKIHSPYQVSQRERIPAEDIIHQFRFIAQEQTRGVPQACCVFKLLIDLEDFFKTAMIASKVGAASGVYFQEKDGAQTGPESLADGIRKDSQGNKHLTKTITPGVITHVDAGYEMKSFDAKYPESSFVGYVSYMLKLIASGMNVSYFILTSSLNEINFSSSKVGLDEEREHWKKEQDWFAECVLSDIFEDWLKTSLLNGAVTYEDGKVVDATLYQQIVDNYEFKGRRWDPADQAKYATFTKTMLELGMTTLTDELMKNGRSYDDILIKKKREEEIRKQYGFTEDPFKIQKDSKEVVKEEVDKNE